MSWRESRDGFREPGESSGHGKKPPKPVREPGGSKDRKPPASGGHSYKGQKKEGK